LRCLIAWEPMPFIPPMLTSRLADAALLADPRYVAKPKLDGQRAQVHVERGRTVAVYSRPGRELRRHRGLAWLRDVRWPLSAAIRDGELFSGEGAEGIDAILTARNGFSAIRRLSQADLESGRFNPLTLVETFTKEWQTPEGKKSSLVKERRYLPSELARYLRQVGFSVEHVWGGTAGRWARRTLELDEAEIMLVARKAGRTI